ncbi:unnamed protein product, partial [marine sediment metagenome]
MLHPRVHISILLLCICCNVFSQLVQPEDSVQAARCFQRAKELYDAFLYDSVPYYYSEALAYYRTNQVTDIEVRCLLGMADTYRILRENDKADGLACEAERLLDDMPRPDSILLAESWFVRGKLAYDHSDYDGATDWLKQSATVFELLDPGSGRLARVINYLGIVYSTRGDLDRAEKYFSRFLELIREYGISPSIEESWYYSNMNLINRKKG